ncbi:MAG: proline dehydrogenase family protein [Elusimicrobia bacterium]|nr:proline dehydrogenase family protein [Elusimicrobiota bacterium]
MATSMERLSGRVESLGRELLRRSAEFRSPLFSRNGLTEKLLDAGMNHRALRRALLTFLDVSPTLANNAEVKGKLLDLLEESAAPGWIARWIPANLLAPGLRFGLRWMAERFIAGETIEEAGPRLEALRREGSDVLLDVLGEGLTSARSSEEHVGRYLDLLAHLPRPHISIKVSALAPFFGPLNEAALVEARERLRRVARAAQKQPGAFLWIDMEQHSLKSRIFQVYRDLLDEKEFSGFDGLGLAVQAYLRETARDLEDLKSWSLARGRRTPVRLVKGAYWDQENLWAAKAGWPVPVWPHKHRTDREFEALSAFLLENPEAFRPAFGTHNARSLAVVLALAEDRGLAPGDVEFQTLFGMAEETRRALNAMGQRTRVYTPYGGLVPGMAYLVRRVLENTANESFLRQSHRRAGPALLLRPPAAETAEESAPGENRGFVNEPLTDWSRPENRGRMADSLAREASSAPSPGGGAGDPGAALERAANAAEAWGRRTVRDRADRLRAAAREMRRRRFELAAKIVREVGKTWVEADADVAEAVDFIEYYTAEAERLDVPPALPSLPGLRNRMVHRPLGPGVVIAPWNFPLAIPCGMTVAALVTGNTVVLKPAEQAPGIARELVDLLSTVCPPGVIQLVPGPGETVGAALVKDPRTQFIAFTGSDDTARHIRQDAADAPFAKRLILETGGKNAIFVDADADLDLALAGVIDSAFGYSGQKCSACSRLILHEKIRERFLAQFLELVAALRVGDPADPSTQVGPLIDDAAFRKVRGYVELGKAEGRLLTPEKADAAARLVWPAVMELTSPRARSAQEEIFGPVVAVFTAGSAPDAFEIMNATRFALTAGVFTRSSETKALFGRSVVAGVKYVNRKITHASVGLIPFGGTRASGTGTHAGGPFTLLQFLRQEVQIEEPPHYEIDLP